MNEPEDQGLIIADNMLCDCNAWRVRFGCTYEFQAPDSAVVDAIEIGLHWVRAARWWQPFITFQIAHHRFQLGWLYD